MSHCSYLSAWLCLQERKWLPFCQQAMCGLGEAGHVVKTYCFNRLSTVFNTNVSLVWHSQLYHCWLSMISALILTSKHFSTYFQDGSKILIEIISIREWLVVKSPLWNILKNQVKINPKWCSSISKNTLHLLVSPLDHSSPLDYLKLITCHCILILGFVMQT